MKLNEVIYLAYASIIYIVMLVKYNTANILSYNDNLLGVNSSSTETLFSFYKLFFLDKLGSVKFADMFSVFVFFLIVGFLMYVAIFSLINLTIMIKNNLAVAHNIRNRTKSLYFELHAVLKLLLIPTVFFIIVFFFKTLSPTLLSYSQILFDYKSPDIQSVAIFIGSSILYIIIVSSFFVAARIIFSDFKRL